MQIQAARIDTISYSQHARYELCPLSLALQRDSSFAKLRKVSPTALLGVATHATVERILRSQLEGVSPGDARDVVAQVWDQECEKQHQILQQAWSPAPVPPVSRWDGFAITRSRVLRHMSSRVWYRQPGVAEPAAANAPKVEVEIIDYDSGIKGVPDLIECRQGAWWLIDLKTGVQQAEASEAQATQLRLYAHLFRKQRGSLPDHLAVVTASGGEFEVELSEALVNEAVAAVLASREAFNAAIEANSILGLAKPSAKSCGWCAYRPVCDSFFGAQEDDWPVRNTLQGVVETVRGSAPSTEVTLRLIAPHPRAGQVSRVIDVWWPFMPTIGQVVGLSGFGAGANWALIRGAWDSVAWPLSSV